VFPQKVERWDGVAPDVIISEESDHLFPRHRFDFGSAIGRVVQLCNSWDVEQMLENDGLEPFKVRCTLISVKVRAGCLVGANTVIFLNRRLCFRLLAQSLPFQATVANA
jgi:hypothetical protein